MGIVNRSFWARLFKRLPVLELEPTPVGWHLIVNGQPANDVNYSEILALERQSGWFWDRLVLRLSALDDSLCIEGLRKLDAQALQHLFEAHPTLTKLGEAHLTLNQLLEADRYLNHTRHQNWQATWSETLQSLSSMMCLRLLPAPQKAQLSELETFLTDTRGHIDRRNKQWVQEEIVRMKTLFDGVEQHPLTNAQRQAIVKDEDNQLVVAGAGTGKTSTVMGKVGYLLERKLASPHEILLLAYNRKARDEMVDRIEERFGVQIDARTFHSLGLRIIAQTEGVKPSLSKLAEDDSKFLEFIQDQVEALLREPTPRDKLLTYFVSYLKPYQPPHAFNTHHRYIQYIVGQDLRTFRNEQVKSFEECTIANWLYVQGVNYEYELNYEHKTASANYRQYRPDFYLPDHGIYIEHFGVDRQGNTAPYVDRTRYHAGMEWKRGIHKQYGTTLIETYSYDRMEGFLVERLCQALERHGVVFNPRPIDELIERLNKRRQLYFFTRLVATFLNHVKGGQFELADLFEQAQTLEESTRLMAFMSIFSAVYARYENHLRDHGEIDFHDMIGRATEHVQSGRYRSGFNYIIVDEFQDMARGRYQLLKGLLDQVEDRRLLCVGDDWQSIYRFAGSDIRFMTRFPDQFGFTATSYLDRTFRFHSNLVTFSERFIRKNKAQLQKSIHANRQSSEPGVEIWTTPSTDEGKSAKLQNALREIQQLADATPLFPAVVFLIGRYNFLRPEDLADLESKFPALKINFTTAHRSKGLEADYVIVQGVISGRFGFPCEIEDDPILELVLPDADDHEHAEERRLFYVATTRAREKVYLVTEDSRQSPFIEELLGEEYRGLVVHRGDISESAVCKECEGGRIVERTNKQTGETFWGCSNYPYCGGTAEKCFVCKSGPLVLEGSRYLCQSKTCDAEAEICPKCRTGMLKRRQNQRTKEYFLGCSRWHWDKTGCDYTRPISSYAPTGSDHM